LRRCQLVYLQLQFSLSVIVLLLAGVTGYLAGFNFSDLPTTGFPVGITRFEPWAVQDVFSLDAGLLDISDVNGCDYVDSGDDLEFHAEFQWLVFEFHRANLVFVHRPTPFTTISLGLVPAQAAALISL